MRALRVAAMVSALGLPGPALAAGSCETVSKWREPAGELRIRVVNDWSGGAVYGRYEGLGSGANTVDAKAWKRLTLKKLPHGTHEITVSIVPKAGDAGAFDATDHAANFGFEVDRERSGKSRSRFVGGTLSGTLSCSRDYKPAKNLWVVEVTFG